MDTGGATTKRVRELPPLPQRGQRSLPMMSSQDTEDVPAPKHKKKRAKKETNELDDTDDQGMEMGGMGSRRASGIGEHLTLEATVEAPPQRRRKKKKTATIGLEDDHADLVNGDTAGQTTDEEVVRKPRKKKKSKVVETQLPDELDVPEDDIIADTPPPLPQHSLFSAPQGQSQPVGKVFVERNSE